MLNYSNVIENDKSFPGLQMREIKPVMKLIIRGKKKTVFICSWKIIKSTFAK